MSSFYIRGSENRDCFSGSNPIVVLVLIVSSPSFNLKQGMVPDISQEEKLLAQSAAFHRKFTQFLMPMGLGIIVTIVKIETDSAIPNLDLMILFIIWNSR